MSKKIKVASTDYVDNKMSEINSTPINDQTPTYNINSDIENLTSGEKISIAFGKIAKAISEFISHINNKVSHITNDERTNWNLAKTHADSDHAPVNAQENVIESIKVNGENIEPKLKEIDIEIQTYTHPTTSGYKHIPSGGSDGQILKWKSDGSAIWSDNNIMTGATSESDGSSGLVPAASAGDQDKFLSADGTWKEVSGSDGNNGDCLPISGGSVTGNVQQSGATTDYETYKFRNISLGKTSTPPTDANYGGNGSIYFYYT